MRYVLELEPDYHPARVNLVSLLTEEGLTEEAAHRVAEGLSIHPGDPELLCAQGLLAMEDGDLGAARLAFDAALDGDPRHAAALANRAVLHAETGDHPAALADLTRAIDVTGDDPDLLFNRGYVHQAAGDPGAAAADYRRAARLPGADQEAIAERLAQCLQAELA
ncbi:tetratricopeptide repeat protein [Actinacidiphila sp. DG2A-62]|nr:tetratricopeptide repeat protein [Actinacidiphila sp. DG2A-62]MEC3992668.1 tetratricopeptide repeat protein [Actinacidiphila sp. DG2A-62]